MELRFDFAEDDSLAGFRLARFEFYNWGTFDGRIFTIEPQGRNALLTGEIGSGKSTIVDALTTLLVPHQRIIYNKAAGAESRERSLESYILGEYKSVKDETFGSKKAATLREASETFSVLLARFENSGFDEAVTLAQFFYLTDKQVKKFFVVSQGPLAVQPDFWDFPDVRALKKRLKRTSHTEVFDSFAEYARDFRRRMGIRNDQALNLFYQTVSLKAIGNLTSFIRGHMLEPSEIDTQIDALCANFGELNRAHDLVLRARQQIEMLTPIDATGKKYEADAARKERLEGMRDALAAFFAQCKIALLEAYLAQKGLEQEKAKLAKGRKDAALKQTQEDLFNVKMNLRQSGADRLSQLENDLRRHESALREKQDAHARYGAQAEALGLGKASNAHRFLKNRDEAQALLETTEAEGDKVQNEKTMNAVTQHRYDEQRTQLEEEIAFLAARRTNIPRRQAKIRDAMAEALGLAQEELPFTGELVRSTDARWQGAIERIMHGFALSLIVDAEYYDAVSRYVERTDLKGKLVYLKVDPKRDVSAGGEPAEASMLHKIEVKADSPFAGAVEAMLFERFNVPCVERLEDFRRFKKALSIRGQFKTSQMRHEKDDRHALDDRTRWVLGWENSDKLVQLRIGREKLAEKITYLAEQTERVATRMRALTARRDALRDLLAVTSFDTIDWYTVSRDMETVREEITALEASSDLIATLRKRQETLEIQEQTQTAERDGLLERLGKLGKQIEDRQNELTASRQLVGEKTMTKSCASELETAIGAAVLKQLTLGTIAGEEQRARSRLQSDIDAAEKRIGRSREKLVQLMGGFVAAFPVESKEFDASVASLGEFRRRLDALKKDDLPRWQKRFKELLKEKMVQHIVLLQNSLEFQSREIREKIDAINASLGGIEYSEGTYITLIAEAVTDREIREFKAQLKGAVSGAIGEDNSYDEQKFLQIKTIIERFNGRAGHSDEDRKWRAKVTDVRQWYDFSASERYVSDGSEKEYYRDSGGKSGGQKEKLAYTVLASSLAFQFGLEHQKIKSRSFRFVMIDEAFGRGSDDSTRYGLRLFERLNLQLLVITPKQKINVIEPYVDTVHFVSNEAGRDSSLLSMKIEEYRQRREASS